jgi:hypothetical protein
MEEPDLEPPTTAAAQNVRLVEPGNEREGQAACESESDSFASYLPAAKSHGSPDPVRRRRFQRLSGDSCLGSSLRRCCRGASEGAPPNCLGTHPRRLFLCTSRPWRPCAPSEPVGPVPGRPCAPATSGSGDPFPL